MTIFQVTRALQTIALTNPAVNNVGDGSIYDFMNANPSIKYGVFFLSQTTHREDELFDYYGYNIFYIDRLVDNLESNRLEIQSIAKEVLSNTIKTFVKKFLGVTHGEIRYTPFTQRFADLCAGQYCNIEFKIPKAVICEENFKEIEIIHDDCAGVYENGYRKGYEDGLNNCPECPDCPDCSGYTQEDLDKAYDDGFESGHTSGVTEQKSLLTDITVTQNGLTYTNPDGFSAVTVDVPEKTLTNLGFRIKNNGKRTYIAQEYGADGFETIEITVDVPQTGHTDQEITDAYNSGVTEGVSQQKAKLIPTAITENGSYVREDGYSAITVNVPQTGYTQQDLDNAYNSGHTSGVTEQKALLSSTTITQNGTYTRENGWSAVTVNVSGYTQEDLDNAYQRGWNDGYQSGYTDGKASEYITVPTSVDFDLSGSTQSVVVGSNTDWNVSTSNNWITVSPTSGSGDDLIDITVASGATDRTGSVIITSSDSSITKTIVINQRNIVDYRGEALTFEIMSNGIFELHGNSDYKTIYYKINDGEWESSTAYNRQISVTTGDIIKLRGDDFTDNYQNGGIKFYNSTCSCKVYGNIMSIVSSTDFSGMTSLSGSQKFSYLFKDFSGLTDASNLILPTGLTESCFYGMFYGCENLTQAPELSATALTPNCYDHMFQYCTSLTTAPELPAITLVRSCYQSMFYGCTSLNYVKCLATDISANGTSYWLNNVASSGTFVTPSSTAWEIGNYGIPQGWVRVDA